MATIVILEHELQRELRIPYMVYAMAGHWRAAGHRVLVHQGLDDPPPGDVAINNIELTKVPAAYAEIFGRYPKVINGGVLDVSKRRFSQLLLTRESRWDGPVIVKTDANFGGKPEALLRQEASRRGLAADIPSGPVADGYPTYASLSEVPEAAWTHPQLVVEKFVPEFDGRHYYLRFWVFCGDRERSSRWSSTSPIVKSDSVVGREEVDVPDALRSLRSQLRFDFGKFDYVKAGDRYYLLDANRTPSLPPALSGEVAAAAMRAVAPGIASYLASPCGT